MMEVRAQFGDPIGKEMVLAFSHNMEVTVITGENTMHQSKIRMKEQNSQLLYSVYSESKEEWSPWMLFI
jgi:hypothetical protein